MLAIGGDDGEMERHCVGALAPHLTARRLASNRRVLCASPACLQKRGQPRSLAELANHDCLVIKERDLPFGVWKLRSGSQEETVKVTGPLSSNNGEIVSRWALDGGGIVLRSLWEAGPYLERGELLRVLPEYRQEANIWAVYPPRLTSSAKVQVCVDFFKQCFRQREA